MKFEGFMSNFDLMEGERGVHAPWGRLVWGFFYIIFLFIFILVCSYSLSTCL